MVSSKQARLRPFTSSLYRSATFAFEMGRWTSVLKLPTFNRQIGQEMLCSGLDRVETRERSLPYAPLSFFSPSLSLLAPDIDRTFVMSSSQTGKSSKGKQIRGPRGPYKKPGEVRKPPVRKCIHFEQCGFDTPVPDERVDEVNSPLMVTCEIESR